MIPYIEWGTKTDRREQKRRNRRKMRVSGRSVMVVRDAKAKRDARVVSGAHGTAFPDTEGAKGDRDTWRS